MVEEIEMKQRNNLSTSGTPIIFSLFSITKMLYGHHQMEYIDFKLNILFLKVGGE